MSFTGIPIWSTIVIAPVVLVIIIVVANFVIIRQSGTPVGVPEIPRNTETIGNGRPLNYAVLGDSTTVSQGSDYDDGFARGSARFLASQGYQVRLTNYGVSGARAADMADQSAQAATIRPDLVLIAVSANDVTHLTPIHDIEQGISAAVDTLRAANPDVSIVITGSPQMGSIPRFPQPAKLLARLRSNQVNHMAIRLVADKRLVFAPIADKTGAAFDQHPEYYASDIFHPNAAGYALWTPVISAAVAEAIRGR